MTFHKNLQFIGTAVFYFNLSTYKYISPKTITLTATNWLPWQKASRCDLYSSVSLLTSSSNFLTASAEAYFKLE